MASNDSYTLVSYDFCLEKGLFDIMPLVASQNTQVAIDMTLCFLLQ